MLAVFSHGDKRVPASVAQGLLLNASARSLLVDDGPLVDIGHQAGGTTERLHPTIA